MHHREGIDRIVISINHWEGIDRVVNSVHRREGIDRVVNSEVIIKKVNSTKHRSLKLKY